MNLLGIIAAGCSRTIGGDVDDVIDAVPCHIGVKSNGYGTDGHHGAILHDLGRHVHGIDHFAVFVDLFLADGHGDNVTASGGSDGLGRFVPCDIGVHGFKDFSHGHQCPVVHDNRCLIGKGHFLLVYIYGDGWMCQCWHSYTKGKETAQNDFFHVRFSSDSFSCVKCVREKSP